MLNINELETRWRRYKIKSYIPHAVITLSMITIITIVYYVMNTKEEKVLQTLITSEKNIPTDNKPTNIPKKQNDVKIINDIAVQQNRPPIKSSKSVVLSPSLGFMSNLKHSNIYNDDKNIPTHQNPTNGKINSQKVEMIEEPEEIEEEIIQESVAVVKSSIKIDRKNSQDDLEYVIERFKKTNNPALSLFIAKKHYSLGEYHKAYNYALITNELNDKVDASWIIFAKSLVKLNEKDEAIKTLKKYINHSHSNRAKILLEEIVSGDFK